VAVEKGALRKEQVNRMRKAGWESQLGLTANDCVVVMGDEHCTRRGGLLDYSSAWLGYSRAGWANS